MQKRWSDVVATLRQDSAAHDFCSGAWSGESTKLFRTDRNKQVVFRQRLDAFIKIAPAIVSARDSEQARADQDAGVIVSFRIIHYESRAFYDWNDFGCSGNTRCICSSGWRFFQADPSKLAAAQFAKKNGGCLGCVNISTFDQTAASFAHG